MASVAHSMGAPAGAPPSETSLSQFEAILGSLEQVAAVLAAAGEEVGLNGMSQRGVLLLYAAEDALDHTIWKTSAAISTAYVEINR